MDAGGWPKALSPLDDLLWDLLRTSTRQSSDKTPCFGLYPAGSFPSCLCLRERRACRSPHNVAFYLPGLQNRLLRNSGALRPCLKVLREVPVGEQMRKREGRFEKSPRGVVYVNHRYCKINLPATEKNRPGLPTSSRPTILAGRLVAELRCRTCNNGKGVFSVPMSAGDISAKFLNSGLMRTSPTKAPITVGFH